MSRVFALAAVVFLAAPVSADDKDWTGKTIKLTANVKLGSKLGGGLVRDGAALDKGKTFVVKSDDGSYLELVGRRVTSSRARRRWSPAARCRTICPLASSTATGSSDG